MPRTKKQFEEVRNATREKIMLAAVEIFAHRGLAATSVQDIADLAQISTGLIYRHYKSKEDLFNELIVQAATELSVITRSFQQEGSPVDTIEQLMQEILRDIANDAEFVQYLALMTQAFMLADVPSAMQKLLDEHAALLQETARLIERGQQLGQFKQGDAYEMAVYYFSVIQGLGVMKFAMKDRFVVPGIEIVLAFLIKEDRHE